MNWNFLAVWIGMKTCNARFGPHQLAVAPTKKKEEQKELHTPGILPNHWFTVDSVKVKNRFPDHNNVFLNDFLSTFSFPGF